MSTSYASRTFTNKNHRGTPVNRDNVDLGQVKFTGKSVGTQANISNFSLGKNISSYFQNLNMSNEIPGASAATSLISAGIGYDDDQARREMNSANTDAENFVTNRSTMNHSAIDAAKNVAVASAQKPWEITDANSDYASRLTANSQNDASMRTQLQTFETNNQNTYNQRMANENFWGSIFGAFGQMGAAIYNDATQSYSNSKFRDSIVQTGFDPIKSQGNHVKLFGSGLPDNLGTLVNPKIEHSNDMELKEFSRNNDVSDTQETTV